MGKKSKKSRKKLNAKKSDKSDKIPRKPKKIPKIGKNTLKIINFQKMSKNLRKTFNNIKKIIIFSLKIQKLKKYNFFFTKKENCHPLTFAI